MLAMVIFINGGSFGQDPNYLMHMDSADVLGGSIFTTIAKLDVLQPSEIQGWSFSLCSVPAVTDSIECHSRSRLTHREERFATRLRDHQFLCGCSDEWSW